MKIAFAAASSFPRSAPPAVAAMAGVVLLASIAATAAPVSLIDDRGKAIALDRPAARVVTLAPHLTELVFAAGAAHTLVGVPRYSDYPEAAKSLPLIGDATRVDFERVLALRPDVVLAWKSGNSPADAARLERLGLKVHVSDAERLDDVARVVRAIGALAGTREAADGAARTFEQRIGALRERHARHARVRVFYQIWDRPLLTVNGRHLISDVLDLCGGENVFSGARLLTPSVSLEALIAARPEAVLGGSSAMSPETFERQWRRRDIAALAAVPVRYVPPDLIQRPTPRIAEGAQVICDHLRALRPGLKRHQQ